MSSRVGSVSDVLQAIEHLATESSTVDLGTLVNSFGSRSYGPLLMLPALMEISPLGGVPGFATTMAIVIALIAGQAIFGRKCVWLPRFLSKRSLKSEKILKAVGKMRPLAKRLDRWFHGRLRSFTRGIAVRVAAGICVLLACIVPPLDLIPFASTAPMTGIALFGFALLAQDGALMVIAFAAAMASFGFAVFLLM
jgi:hypothetical protein